jgi:diguanylate cyclase (GGDEF)-like protein/PAS domain S-box-containing protein
VNETQIADDRELSVTTPASGRPDHPSPHDPAARNPEPTPQQLALLLEAVADFGIAMLDPHGAILTWNRAAETVTGYSRDEMTGRSYLTLLPEPEPDPANPHPGQPLAVAATQGRWEQDGWARRKDGTRFWALCLITPIYTNGHLDGFASVIRDLTARRERNEALRRSEASLQKERDRLQVTLESIADGVISTDVNGRILFLNPVAAAMTGWTLEQARGLPIAQVFTLLPDSDGMQQPNPIEICLHTGVAYPMRDGSRLLSRNGHERHIQESASPIVDHDGNISGAVLVFQDVTHMRQVQTQLRHQTLHDALTGLPNRKQLENKLHDAIEDAEVRGTEHVLCFLDLDRFKIINDTAGHSVGDMFLRAATEAIRRQVRETDLVARLGGDEFAILLLDCKLEEASHLLTRVADSIAGIQFQWEGHSYQVTVSIGVAAITARSGSSSHVMKQADVACYSAKRAGRNRVMLYRPDQAGGEENHRELHMAAEIGEALAQGRFVLHAQRIVPTRPGGSDYCEILVRMLDRDGGLIHPSEFIPAAERYDLMVDVDRWVMRQTLGRLAPQLLRHPRLTVSINLSAQSLNDPKFLPFFLDLLHHSGIPGSRIILEITETALVNNLEIASSIVERLRTAGCRVALDDFGTGLSSFGYLRTFHVDALGRPEPILTLLETFPFD